MWKQSHSMHQFHPQLADAMLETGYNGYPVVDDEDQIIGIVTQSDLLKLIYEIETQ